MFQETQDSYGKALFKLMKFCRDNILSFNCEYSEDCDQWELKIQDFDIKKTTGYVKNMTCFESAVNFVIEDFQREFKNNYPDLPKIDTEAERSA